VRTGAADISFSDDTQLLTLLAHDPDPFNRWEAGQRLLLRCAISAIAEKRRKRKR
jgi:aminopeptidase N